jgi:hypothetical protein
MAFFSYKRFFNVPPRNLSNDQCNFRKKTRDYLRWYELFDYYAFLRFEWGLKPELVIKNCKF